MPYQDVPVTAQFLVAIALLAFGGLCHYVAGLRRRDRWAWFWAGCLLGPLALVVIFLPKQRRGQEQESIW